VGVYSSSQQHGDRCGREGEGGWEIEREGESEPEREEGEGGRGGEREGREQARERERTGGEGGGATWSYMHDRSNGYLNLRVSFFLRGDFGLHGDCRGTGVRKSQTSSSPSSLSLQILEGP